MEGDAWSALLAKFDKYVFRRESPYDLTTHMTACLTIVRFMTGACADVPTVLAQYGVNAPIGALTRQLYDWASRVEVTGESVATAAHNVRGRPGCCARCDHPGVRVEDVRAHPIAVARNPPSFSPTRSPSPSLPLSLPPLSLQSRCDRV